MIQFDDHIFQMGWNHQLVLLVLCFGLFLFCREFWVLLISRIMNQALWIRIWNIIAWKGWSKNNLPTTNSKSLLRIGRFIFQSKPDRLQSLRMAFRELLLLVSGSVFTCTLETYLDGQSKKLGSFWSLVSGWGQKEVRGSWAVASCGYFIHQEFLLVEDFHYKVGHCSYPKTDPRKDHRSLFLWLFFIKFIFWDLQKHGLFLLKKNGDFHEISQIVARFEDARPLSP